MTTKSILFGARRAKGTGLGAEEPAGLALPKSVANKAGIRWMPVTIPLARNSASRSPLQGGFLPFAISPRSLLAIASLSAWFALSPSARAVLPPPPPDGGYPGQNTAEGDGALASLTTGTRNTAIGFRALLSSTTGGDNTASGNSALRSNIGSFNTATGSGALASNTTGGFNVATGFKALFSSTQGYANTATGPRALTTNITGSGNTAIGHQALLFNTTGSSNIALGESAGLNLTTGDNNIDIGNQGIPGDANIIRIGTVGVQNATFIAGIRGATVASGVGVIVGSNGQLGTIISSARFKEAIKPMDKASEAILALKPVTFRYKRELDPEGIPQFGLVAEQVAKVSPDLVARDDQGKANTVRYEAVNAMLLNEFLKEHRKVQELEAAIARQEKDFARQFAQQEKDFAQQQKEIKALAASLKEQASQIRKMSGRLGVSKPATQTAAGG